MAVVAIVAAVVAVVVVVVVAVVAARDGWLLGDWFQSLQLPQQPQTQ